MTTTTIFLSISTPLLLELQDSVHKFRKVIDISVYPCTPTDRGRNVHAGAYVCNIIHLAPYKCKPWTVQNKPFDPMMRLTGKERQGENERTNLESTKTDFLAIHDWWGLVKNQELEVPSCQWREKKATTETFPVYAIHFNNQLFPRHE